MDIKTIQQYIQEIYFTSKRTFIIRNHGEHGRES